MYESVVIEGCNVVTHNFTNHEIFISQRSNQKATEAHSTSLWMPGCWKSRYNHSVVNINDQRNQGHTTSLTSNTLHRYLGFELEAIDFALIHNGPFQSYRSSNQVALKNTYDDRVPQSLPTYKVPF